MGRCPSFVTFQQVRFSVIERIEGFRPGRSRGRGCATRRDVVCHRGRGPDGAPGANISRDAMRRQKRAFSRVQRRDDVRAIRESLEGGAVDVDDIDVEELRRISDRLRVRSDAARISSVEFEVFWLVEVDEGVSDDGA